VSGGASLIEPGHPSIDEIENEGRTRAVGGWTGRLAGALSIGLSLYALYWVVGIVQPQIYRVSFLLISLVLIFLLFRGSASGNRLTAIDWTLAALSVVALAWPIVDFDQFVYRAASPFRIDVRADSPDHGHHLSALWVLRAGARSDRVVAHRAQGIPGRSACRDALHDPRRGVRRSR
jgi:hypothetical protein